MWPDIAKCSLWAKSSSGTNHTALGSWLPWLSFPPHINLLANPTGPASKNTENTSTSPTSTAPVLIHPNPGWLPGPLNPSLCFHPWPFLFPTHELARHYESATNISVPNLPMVSSLTKSKSKVLKNGFSEILSCCSRHSGLLALSGTILLGCCLRALCTHCFFCLAGLFIPSWVSAQRTPPWEGFEKALFFLPPFSLFPWSSYLQSIFHPTVSFTHFFCSLSGSSH